MSYYGLSKDIYRNIPSWTPGAQLAPVPGWGKNVLRAGPPILAMHGETTIVEVPYKYGFGHVALGFVAGALFGAASVYAATRK